MKQKNILSLFLALAIVFSSIGTSIPVFASGTPNPESDFTFDSSTGTITGYNGASKDVIIPKKIGEVEVKSIGEHAFGNNNLTSVIIPEGVTSIGNYAFIFNSLTSIIIPEGVTSIGVSAFSSNNLTSVTLPEGITSIGDNAFSSNNLTSVTLPEGITNIGNSAFSGNNLTSVIIPEGVTSIEENSFRENQLTSVILPEGITNIGTYAFFLNPNLTSIKLPSTLKGIEESAFQYNDLTSIIIPEGVTNIGNNSFSNNNNLKKVIFEGNAPETVGEGVFEETSEDLVIYHKPQASGFNIFSLMGYTVMAMDSGGEGSGDEGGLSTRLTGTSLPVILEYEVPLMIELNINPNEVYELAFQAPLLNVGNNSNFPLSLYIEKFEPRIDSPHKFDDVLPTFFENWKTLKSNDSSNYLALGLKANDSTEWRVLDNEDTIYAKTVQDSISPILIGEIDPHSTVSLAFEASHGYSFKEVKEFAYDGVFVFGITD